MEQLLSKTGRGVMKVLVKVLAAACAGILSLIETADRERRKGGK